MDGPMMLGIVVLTVVVGLGGVFLFGGNYYKEDNSEASDTEPKKEKKVERWSEIKLGSMNDVCPRCKTGMLVYSTSNIGLRVGSMVEYYYCINCRMDTVAGRAG